MVYESYPWKQDLLRRKRLFLKYNTVEQFERNEEASYTVLEKAVFYSAFIIRKLIDCRGKLSDEADQYTICSKAYSPLKEVNTVNRWPDENTHDWDNYQKKNVKGKDICNWLIHSYMFFFSYSEEGLVDGFLVTSDYDRNKFLYHIDIADWLDYISYIANDSIVSMSMHYDSRSADYIYTSKERGRMK